MDYDFTKHILEILEQYFGTKADAIFEASPLLQYVNIKTRSVNKGSKARASFANLYALYVLIEDYIAKGFDLSGYYREYEGAKFSDLLIRQRQLPFGSKLQNHALNSRVNGEYARYFPTSDYIPILRDLQTNRYWINENLLIMPLAEQPINLARALLVIIEKYIEAKLSAFASFIATSRALIASETYNVTDAVRFITDLLAPQTDARIFEIVSYAILKIYYRDTHIYWGFTLDALVQEPLNLYKTGRTNANDGGIDFVMRPLGRFFQVTETLDVKKYFLDIDKIQRYPITFVIKSSDSAEIILQKLRANAEKLYTITVVVEQYMASIEEIINLGKLQTIVATLAAESKINAVIDEIVTQSKLEFNYEGD